METSWENLLFRSVLVTLTRDPCEMTVFSGNYIVLIVATWNGSLIGRTRCDDAL